MRDYALFAANIDWPILTKTCTGIRAGQKITVAWILFFTWIIVTLGLTSLYTKGFLSIPSIKVPTRRVKIHYFASFCGFL